MYNPWDKNLEEIDAPDLEVLHETFEGWYIEYKREFPKPADLAKVLSAFANCDGGWLFLGISQANGDDSRADRIGLLSTTDGERAKLLIEEVSYQRIQPRIWFESKWVPCMNADSVEDASEGVLVVKVDPIVA